MSETPSVWEWVAGLCATALAAILGWMQRDHDQRLKNHDERLREIEDERENKSDAERAREALRRELHDFSTRTATTLDSLQREGNARREEIRTELVAYRGEMSDRLEVLRTETNEKLDKLFDQIGALVSTYAKLKGRR